MKVVAVIGAAGGTGATSVAAHLAEASVLQRRHALVLDFSAANLLRLYFGMEWSDASGLAPQILAGEPWQEAAYQGPTGIAFVPFGGSGDPVMAERFADWLRSRPDWFAQQCATLALAEDALLICDCPYAATTIRNQVLSVADAVLLVARPDTACVASLQQAMPAIAVLARGEVATVLNGFDAARQLDRDIAVLMRSDPRYRLSPVTLHTDEYIREALAHKRTALDYAPASQAASDFRALWTWVVARLGQLDGATA